MNLRSLFIYVCLGLLLGLLCAIYISHTDYQNFNYVVKITSNKSGVSLIHRPKVLTSVVISGGATCDLLHPEKDALQFPSCHKSKNALTVLKKYGHPFDSKWLSILKDLQLNVLPSTYPPFNGSSVVDHPPFVTSTSSNHYHELEGYIHNLQSIFGKFRLIVFDMGLTSSQVRTVRKACNVEVRPFPFNRYPSYVKSLSQYRWKALAISEALKTLNVFWYADSSITWKASNFHKIAYGALDCNEKGDCANGMSSYRLQDNGGFVRLLTDPGMFKYLDVSRDALVNQTMYGGGFAFVVKSRLTMVAMRWYVLCSLQEDCMAPPNAKLSGCRLDFGFPGRAKFSGCHRFDQSAINVILGQLNNFNMTKYTIPNEMGQKYADVVRDRRKTGALKFCS